MPRFAFFLLSSALLLCSCNGASDSPSGAWTDHKAVPEQQQDPAAEQTEAAAAEEAAPAEVTGNVFGQPITLTETISSGELLAEPGKYEGKTLLVKGEVVDVCQKMGCWMVITDGEHSIRVTTKGHGFFVRKDGTGSVALVQGTLRHIAPNPERTAHLEGESAKPKAMPEKAGVEYEIDADGIVFTEAPKAG